MRNTNSYGRNIYFKHFCPFKITENNGLSYYPLKGIVSLKYKLIFSVWLKMSIFHDCINLSAKIQKQDLESQPNIDQTREE